MDTVVQMSDVSVGLKCCEDMEFTSAEGGRSEGSTLAKPTPINHQDDKHNQIIIYSHTAQPELQHPA